jgi:hypothetical protein
VIKKKDKPAVRPSGTGITTGTQVSKARVVRQEADPRHSTENARVTTPQDLLDQARTRLEADKKAGILSKEQIAAREAQIKRLEEMIEN